MTSPNSLPAALTLEIRDVLQTHGFDPDLATSSFVDTVFTLSVRQMMRAQKVARLTAMHAMVVHLASEINAGRCA